MSTIFVLPVEGRRIRKPDGQLLAAKGERVAISTYWLRAHWAGDVSLQLTSDSATTVTVDKAQMLEEPFRPLERRRKGKTRPALNIPDQTEKPSEAPS